MNPLKNKRKTLENAVFKAFSRVFALVGATGFEPVRNIGISMSIAF